MKNVIVFGAMALLMVGLTTGCMRAKAERRADARAAQAERQRAQDVDVNINVERNEEERRATSGITPNQEREPVEPGDVAATMIAPEECPMVEGSQVSLIDLGDGAALEFVAADADEVQVVRDRVLNIAVKHQRAMQERLNASEPHAAGEAHAGRQGRAGMGSQARMEASIDPMPPSHVAVVDVDRGSRIIFVPVDRSDLDQLNDALQQRTEFMAEGSCPANLMSMRVPASEIPG